MTAMSAAAPDDPPAGRVAAWSPDQPGSRYARADLAGTVAFVVVLAIGIPLRDERPVQILVGVVSMVLFAIGAVGCLWAYVSALERSRVDEIGVANLYLLTGRTAPPPVKRTMSLLLGAQVVISLAAAIVGAVGLTGSQVNALAFGILVPMFGLAMNSLWAVRHGSYGPRIDKTVRPSNRRID
ncbi:unannotated protein [freshwater metagenome]|jgi:hypothetical protein|uniref:Unannotated protein n=1 Tax=freshwater metagenome TaxID=449393 RepID=A0A6J6GHV5_9ZZZZ